MKRDEDGEWLRLEPRPDLAVAEDAEAPRRRKARPAPGKVTRTLALPATGPGAARVTANMSRPVVAPPVAAATDPLPDVFGGALPSSASTSAARNQPADVAAARAALDQAFAAHRTALVAAAGSQGPLLQQAAAAEHAATLTAIAARETDARRAFAAARAAIRDAEREQIALATVDAELTARRIREAKEVGNAYRTAASSEADRIEGAGLMAATIVETSGSVLLATLRGISGNALHNAHLELRPGEGEAVNERLEAVRTHHTTKIARERYELRASGIFRAREVRAESRNVVEYVKRPMVDAADEVVELGAKLAAFFEHMATVGVEELAATEARVMHRFAEQRARAADVVGAAPLATNRVKERVRTHLDTLTQRHIAVNQSLDRAGRAGQAVLTAVSDEQRALLDNLAQTMLAATNGAAAAFTAEIGQRREQAMSALDSSLAALSSELHRASASFKSDLEVQRTTVVQGYAAAENAVFTAALTPLGDVLASWKANGDAFVGKVSVAASQTVARYAADTRDLQRTVTEIVNDTILDARNPKRRARESLRASGRGVIRGAKSFAKGVGLFVGVNLIGGPLGAVAFGVYGAFENLRHRISALESTWDSRGTFGKIEGVVEATFAVAGDQFGVTPIVEGMVQHEAVTHRHLDAEAAAAKSTEGLLAAATAAVLERVGTPTTAPVGAKPAVEVTRVAPPLEAGPSQPRARPRPRGDAHGEVSAGVEQPQVRGGEFSKSAPTTSGARVPSAGEGAARPQPQTASTIGESPRVSAGGAPRSASRGSECFVADTRVSTPSGPRPIHALRAGDKVHALDLTNNVITTATVLASISSMANSIREIVVPSGVIRCTPAHPFWTPTSGWQPAGALSVGSQLRSSSLGIVTVEIVRDVVGEFRVFNMEVAGHHNYLVGEDSILVHNKPQRWTAQDRAFSLKERAAAALQDAVALPDGAPGRVELVRRAERVQAEAGALDTEATSPRESASSMDAQRSRIEAVEQELLAVEEGIDVATLPTRARGIRHRARALLEAAEVLPNEVAGKWELIEDLRRVERDATTVKELVDENPASSRDLQADIERVEADLRDLEHAVGRSQGAPPASSALPRPALEYPANHLPTGGKRPYVPPRQAGNPEIVRHPEGRGYLDENGNRWEWARDQHAGPHWDVQHPNGWHTNVYPDGNVHQGEDRF